jgi:hypothetical protein
MLKFSIFREKELTGQTPVITGKTTPWTGSKIPGVRTWRGEECDGVFNEQPYVGSRQKHKRQKRLVRVFIEKVLELFLVEILRHAFVTNDSLRVDQDAMGYPFYFQVL